MESSPSTTPKLANHSESSGNQPARSVYIYTGTIAAIGVGLAVCAILNLSGNYFGILLFVVLAIIAEIFSVELFQSSRGSHVSVSSIVAIASVLVFGPWAGALTHMASGFTTAFTTTVMQRQKPQNPATWIHRLAFNTGMWVIATASAGFVYILAGGHVGIVMRPSNILPLILAAFVDWFLNVSMLLGVISLQTGGNPIQIFREEFQWTGPISVAGGVIGGGALALAFEISSFIGVIVFFSSNSSYNLFLSSLYRQHEGFH
jgi:hypothetical protein